MGISKTKFIQPELNASSKANKRGERSIAGWFG